MATPQDKNKNERRSVRGITASEAVAKKANARRERMVKELETRLSFLAIMDVLTEGLADLADDVRGKVSQHVEGLRVALDPDAPAAKAPKAAAKAPKAGK